MCSWLHRRRLPRVLQRRKVKGILTVLLRAAPLGSAAAVLPIPGI